MGNAIAIAVKHIAKKLIFDFFTEPEKVVKFILLVMIIPLLLIVIILVLPTALFVSFPMIFLHDNTEPEMLDKQLDVIAIYQDAPIAINEENLEWIEKKKDEYSWADSIRVRYSYNLTWQDIMAIDSVKLKQDFNNINRNDVLKLGREFIDKDVRTEKYKVKEYYYVTVKGRDGNDRKVRKSKWVTKTRAIISISTKEFSNVVDKQGFNKLENDMAHNIYSNISNIDAEGNLNIYDDADLEELKQYPPGNANIVYYHQADKRWGNNSYGNSTIKAGGCGPTSLAMVVASLKGDTSITPKVVADWSVKMGHRAEGIGSYWSLMTDGGRHYGLQVEQVSRRNPKKIIKALSDGYPVVVAMGRGHFTKGGHFIVLTGITDDGKILVNDSASSVRSKKAWDISIIMNESSTNGGVNGCPFWIFRP